MRPSVVLSVLVASAMFGGCTCGNKAPSAGEDKGDKGEDPASSAASPSSASASSANAAIFSAPIAAAQTGNGAVIVAGLVVGTKTISAQRIEADGRVAWTRELIREVAWSEDADLKAYALPGGAAAGGAAVVWRGLRSGKNAKVLASVAADGRALEPPADIGALACSTDDGVAWNETVPGGKTRLHLHTWAAGAPPRDDLGVAIEDDVTLICGAHRAFALSEGEEDSPARTFAVPDAPGFSRTLGADIFGRDEARDLFPFTDGDDLGVVRISASGAVQVADTQQAKPVLLGRGKQRIPVDDDIVAADADARAVYVVYTHDEEGACKDDRGGASVHALRIPRNGDAAGANLVARAECGKDAGPFWTGSAGGSFVIAWAERTPRASKTSAPIASLAYRVMDGKAEVQRIAQPADALVDAGCAGARCYAVALAREPGADGMKPEAARVIPYP